MLQETIWIIDQAKLKPVLIQAMAEGKAAIHDGVAYWAEGSGGSGIIQHLPFKESAAKSVEEALKMAQATTVIAAAVSTGIILAAIVVQTKYLAKKLDKIQATVDVIAQDVRSQHIVFYMGKISEYVGLVEAARTLLQDRSLASEIRELAIPLLTSMAAKRNEILSFIDNILAMAKSSKDVSPTHLTSITNFAQLMLDMMPAGIHIEYLLCARIGKLRLAEHILLDGAGRFNDGLQVFRRFMNGLHQEMIRGGAGARSEVYRSLEANARQLFQSEHGKILLSLPAGRAAS
ncbi:hypothetical protein [Janthinobacterium sp. RA13]|uniref:hypothetical protein n=1 Tax=Janthinobacterium sp. RA13 TaxID=1502762 RepID=UPI000562F443|nr:hypothetical protein [Janthinobacterium sp. RA13]